MTCIARDCPGGCGLPFDEEEARAEWGEAYWCEGLPEDPEQPLIRAYELGTR